jgi:Ca-activated chloride channel family protein
MSSRFAGHERHYIKVLLLLCAVSVLSVLAVGSGVCRASTPPAGNLVFILDASGSMGAQIEGKRKMDIAKEVMCGLINDLPDGANVGLTAYGHRSKGDCKDVEELAPLGPINKSILVKKIKALNHKGKTPITFSVQKVAESLKTLEDETTIILVSDGEETCEGDPCALVKELKESGIKFVLHVIGFDVSEKEKEQLACMAEAGGGAYFTAKTAGELSLAAKKVVEKKEPPTGDALKVKALRNGKPFSAHCIIYKAGEAGEEDGEKKERLTQEWTGEKGAAFKLLPGVYDVVVENQADAQRPKVSFDQVTIEAGKSVEKVADFSGGTLKVKALRNGKPLSAHCTVYKAKEAGEEDGEKKRLTQEWTGEDAASFKLMPGVYDVVVENQQDAGRPKVSFESVTVEPGKSVEKIADFSGGTLNVKALRNGKPLSAHCTVYKAKEAGEEDGEKKERLTQEWTGEKGAAFKLMPGVYDVVVENHQSHEKKEYNGVTIESDKTQALEVQF